jgi:hypothetical protein
MISMVASVSIKGKSLGKQNSLVLLSTIIKTVEYFILLKWRFKAG